MKVRPGPLPAFPWDKWLALKPKTITLVRGKHYTSQPHSMAVQLRTKAKKLGIRIKVEIDGDTIRLTKLGHRLRS